MMTRSSKIAIWVAMAIWSFAATSCRSDIGGDDAPIMWGDEIAFNVALDGEWNNGSPTKANSQADHLATVAFGRDSLMLSCEVKPNRTLQTIAELHSPKAEKGAAESGAESENGAAAENVATATDATETATENVAENAAPTADPTTQSRGSITTTASLSEYFVTAALSPASMYFEHLAMTPESKTGKFWPTDHLTFLAYSPEGARPETFTAPDAAWQATFSYTMPEPTADSSDAVEQPDYIYCIKPNAAKSSEAIDLTFHHAFAAITFKVGNMPDNTVVQSISLNKIYSTATCTVTESSGDVLFAWAGQNTQKSYTQAFNRAVEDGGDINTAAQTFMVVPQTLPADAELSITFTVNGNPYTLTHTFNNLNITQWQADKIYTYTLSINNEVQIEVTDTVTDYTVKNNVEIKNEGLNPVYIRAAIVGCWEKEIGNEWQSIKPWNDNSGEGESYGEFVWGSSWSTYWVRHTDGFYYYKRILPKGSTTTVPLFESYTLTEDPPALNAELRLHIVVQAVVANDAGKAEWSHLSTLFP